VRAEWDDPDEPRVRMLETLRHFAVEQLAASGEAEDVQARHAAYFVGLAERAESELYGPDQQRWLARLDRDRHNLAAVERRATARGDAETVARLGAALWRFWWARADAAEAHERVNAILTLARQAAPSSTLALALHAAGSLAALIGEYATSRSLLEAGEAVARGLEDRRPLARVLTNLGRLEFVEGHYAESRRSLDESLAILRGADDRAGLVLPLNYRGFVDYIEGHESAAREYFGEALALARAAADRVEIGHILHNIGLTYHVEGDVARAEPFYREAVAIMRESRQGQLLTMALGNFGHAVTLSGDVREARTLLGEALSLARTMGNRRRLAFTLWGVAALAAVEGQAERAVRFEAAVIATLDALGAVLARPMRELLLVQVAAARQALGEAAAETAASAGRATTLDLAVDEALAWLGEPPAAPGLAAAGPAAVEDVQRPGSPPAPLATDGPRGAALPRSPVSVLTPREREVAGLLGRGFSNRQIAEALVISLRTAENHVANICDKLGLSSRTQVTAWAVEQGLHRQ
jgi:DNA-binding CsgD family transcriptional regulator/tetratricopeptide (TPR) repeat protein